MTDQPLDDREDAEPEDEIAPDEDDEETDE